MQVTFALITIPLTRNCQSIERKTISLPTGTQSTLGEYKKENKNKQVKF